MVADLTPSGSVFNWAQVEIKFGTGRDEEIADLKPFGSGLILEDFRHAMPTAEFSEVKKTTEPSLIYSILKQ